MSLRDSLRNLHPTLKSGSAARRPRKRVCLALEGLEDRTVPTVVFNPHFGSENVNPGDTTRLSSPPVYLTFWGGSYWQQTAAGQQMATNIENQAASLLSGPYLNHLIQYGSNGQAFLSKVVFDNSDPSNGFTDDQVRSVFNNRIDSDSSDPNHLPESDETANAPIYLVLTPPNVQYNVPNDLGYHAMDYDTDFVAGFPPSLETDTMAYAWIGGSGPTASSQLDSYMSTMSHEVAEAMTDPEAGYQGNWGVTTTQPNFPFPTSSNEISDWEPDGGTYTYRVNGVLTQPYWSASDNAFVSPDGNSQNFFLTPQYDANNNFLGTYSLTINGDQLANKNDTITVGLTNTGGVTATLNGETVTFDLGQISAIKVNGGTGSDAINVESTAVPVTINDSTGSDTIQICPTSQFLNNIQGAVTINGDGKDALIVNDQTDKSNDTYTITSTTVQRNASAKISYGGLDGVLINGGPGALGGGITYNINRTASGTPVTVNAGAGNDTFNVSPSVAFLGGSQDTLFAAVNVVGNGGVDKLNVNDQADAFFGDIYTITSSAIARTGSAPIGYSTVESVVVNGGRNSDTYNINSTASGTPVTVNAGVGNDTFNVSPSVAVPGGSKDTLFGAVTVLGNGGIDKLNVNDQSDAFGGDIYTITSSAINRTAMAQISYFTMESLVVNGGSGGDTFNVNSTPAGVPVTVNGGTGNDTGNVAGLPSSTLTFNLMGGHNTAESSLPGVSTWQISPSAAGVTKVTLGSSVTFAQVWNVIGGSGNDVFQFLVNGSLGGTLNGGGGINTLDYSLYTSGVSVQLANAPALGTATGVGIGSGTVPTAAVSNIQNLIGSRSNDTLIGNDQGNVIQPWGGKDVVKGNGGNDIVRLTGLQDPASTIDGGTGTNELWAPDGVNTWTLTSAGAGNLVSTANTNSNPLYFTNMQQLLGGLNTDTFRFVPSVAGSNISNWFTYLNGNFGTNWLDYSSYTGTVAVNLAANTATGVAGANVHYIQNVIGSQSAANNLTGDNDSLGNILVGGNAADTITGGNTRSILIGGPGSDVVTGGTADDIVIGGYTDYDHNKAALQAIMTEWLSPTDIYLTRIGKIRAGISSGSSTYSLIWGSTVHDDSGASGLGLDTLRGDPHGSSITGMDWFFANLGPGGVLDSFPDGRQAGEKVNNQP